MTTKPTLTPKQRAFLRQAYLDGFHLAGGSFKNRTAKALERKGYVNFVHNPKVSIYGSYHITEAGKAALKEMNAKADPPCKACPSCYAINQNAAKQCCRCGVNFKEVK